AAWPGCTYSLELSFPEGDKPRISREQFRVTGSNQIAWFAAENGTVNGDLDPDRTPQPARMLLTGLFLTASMHPTVVAYARRFSSMTAYNFDPEAIRRPWEPNPGNYLDSNGYNLASVLETTNNLESAAVNRVGRYLTAIVPEIRRFSVRHLDDYRTIRFQMANGQEFNASSMSDGTLRILAALTAVFQSIAVRGAPSLVAIEEPETGLHPDAMRALVAALDEATLRTQVLITTHSPDLLDADEVSPANVRIVELTEGKTVIAPVDQAYVEIISRKLNTLAGLERYGDLHPDLDDLDRQRGLASSVEIPAR
ncbi:MAG: AAA family ATPase, partial [Gemmataceae bacterium]